MAIPQLACKTRRENVRQGPYARQPGGSGRSASADRSASYRPGGVHEVLKRVDRHREVRVLHDRRVQVGPRGNSLHDELFARDSLVILIVHSVEEVCQ